MSTSPVRSLDSENKLSKPMLGEADRVQRVIAWSSLFFVLLQSVCTFFTALGGLRLVIGMSSLASIVSAGEVWDRFHADWIRIPMMTFALVGALLSLSILMRVRRLRNRPASQWRQAPVTRRTLQMERAQLILSLATLVLILLEEVTHMRTFHRF
jgi:hypothetical protein